MLPGLKQNAVLFLLLNRAGAANNLVLQNSGGEDDNFDTALQNPMFNHGLVHDKNHCIIWI